MSEDMARAKPVGGLTDGHVYAIALVGAFSVVFVGFAPTYFLKTVFATPRLTWLLHLHGLLMTSWFAAFAAQVWLVEAHHVRCHRRLGWFAAGLAVLMVIVGTVVAITAAARDIRLPPTPGPPPLQLMGFLLINLLVFTLLVGTGVLMRKRPGVHKPLMALSCLCIVGPGLTRISVLGSGPLSFLRSGGACGLFSLDLLLVYALVIAQTLRARRLNAALVAGALLIVAMDSPALASVFTTPVWSRFAGWLVS